MTEELYRRSLGSDCRISAALTILPLSVSRTRRLIDLETHGSVFSWMLGVLAENGLVDGKTVGVDASTLEANAAMRSIVRRDTGASYTEFLEGLMI